MENLVIDETRFTPEIVFDCREHILAIRGKSYPENTADFYSPVFQWLEEYFRDYDPEQITVRFDIIYFNSSSSKVLLDFFDMFEAETKGGKKIIIQWLFEESDCDMMEFGEEFQEDYSTLNIQILRKSGETELPNALFDDRF